MVLVVIDAYSHYPEVEFVEGTSAKVVLPVFEKVFTTHGIPNELKSDNGRPFQSEAFQKFAEEKGFTHKRITPRWPEANGQAENFMKNIGKVAKTAHIHGKDWKRELYIFLANYRDTLHPSTGQSPYTLSMGRSIRTKLPSIRIDSNAHSQVKARDRRAKAEAKAYADQNRGTLPHQLEVGDTALVRQEKSSKLTTTFESNPYVDEGVKGSMVSAERIKDQRKVTRNSSHFKKMDMESIKYDDATAMGGDEQGDEQGEIFIYG